MSYYNIDGTKNIHTEQSTGAYLDPNFWPNFNNTIKDFQLLLIEKNKKKESFSLLRLGHSEMSSFYIGLNINKKVGNFVGRQSNYDTLPKNTLIKMFESINTADYISTQIGYDFKSWIQELLKFLDCYKKNKHISNLFTDNKIFLNHEYPVKKFNDLVNVPLEIIYAFIVNKWFFKTFKNKIGLIGAEEKLKCIEDLIKHKEYQTYLETDFFTDYIYIPQKAALDDVNIEINIENKLKKSHGEIFLIGAGVSKLKFYHLLKKTKNCIFLDVGHGIDLLSGYGDITRPHCGNWQNYRTKIKNNIDFMGGECGNIIYL